MLTVKYIDHKGHEHIHGSFSYVGAKFEDRDEDNPDADLRRIVIADYAVGPRNESMVFGPSKGVSPECVYVMNEAGATVAKYML